MKKLNIYYYGMLVLACALATMAYLLIMKDVIRPIDPMSQWGQIIQYVVIMDAIITIPFGLYWHKRNCKKWQVSPEQLQNLDDAIKQAYYRSARNRILLVSNAMILGIAASYLVGACDPAHQSMLWIAGISAIGWYFTKPTEKKMFMELQPESY
ncbi:MAG: hypothetical protein MJZ75_04615 [Paludibacteraceae bacterium]|nr:hypothetical protein [Paludibacteraceae bacterium]